MHGDDEGSDPLLLEGDMRGAGITLITTRRLLMCCCGSGRGGGKGQGAILYFTSFKWPDTFCPSDSRERIN